MGTDIHVQVEKKVDGKWVRVPEPPVNILDDWTNDYIKENPERAKDYRGWDCGRNYLLFSVLANVRNGYGFAGVPTYDPIKPIAEPRGFPDDVSKEILDIIHGNTPEYGEIGYPGWLGDHSFSYVTLEELKNYNWDHSFMQTGVVPLAQFLERIKKNDYNTKEEKLPPYEEWSGGIMGPKIVTLDAAEVVKKVKGVGLVQEDGIEYHVQDSWNDSIRRRLSYWLDKWIPALEMLGEPQNVRMIFGFDS